MTREGKLSSKQFEDIFHQIEFDVENFVIKEGTMDLCVNPIFPAASLPKSMDLLHIRTALWFQNEGRDLEFASCDQKQKQAAAELKIPLYSGLWYDPG